MRSDYHFYTYIMASKKNGTLYIGVTNDINRRVTAHKTGTFEGFTKQYRVNTLVYFEHFISIENAIRREKYLKGKTRAYKISLIEEKNLYWDDLSKDWNIFSIPPAGR